jgi:putative sugar O-methyltransferase
VEKLNIMALVYQRALMELSLVLPRVAAAINVPERRRRKWMLQHPRGGRSLRVKSVVVPDRLPTAHDVAIASRLLAAHRASEIVAPSTTRRRPDEWTIIYERQSRMAALLRAGDPKALAAYLCNAPRQDATHGFLQGEQEYRRLTRDPTYRHWAMQATRDNLISLAEAVGAIPIASPDEWVRPSQLRSDPDALVQAIERRLGFPIAPPDVDGGVVKLATSGGMFIDRDLWGVYAAFLIRDALDDSPRRRVCEIGAGAGRAAYWSHRLGITGYTLVDLPHANVVQGHHMLKTLPEDQVVLYGEPGWQNALDRVRVLPAHAATTTAGHDYDLVLNQNSFPEMHPTIVGDYLSWIAQVCAGGKLLSVNHERKARYGRVLHADERDLAHVCTAEAVEAAGGYQRLQRHPYWLRRGYAVELYRVGEALCAGSEDLHVGAVADDEAVRLR